MLFIDIAKKYLVEDSENLAELTIRTYRWNQQDSRLRTEPYTRRDYDGFCQTLSFAPKRNRKQGIHHQQGAFRFSEFYK